jgi:hypothetical protein
LTITSGLEKDQQNKTEVLFHHSMLQYSGVLCTCFEHSNLFKVNVAGRTRHPAKGTAHDYGREPTSDARTRHKPADPATPAVLSTREECRVLTPGTQSARTPLIQSGDARAKTDIRLRAF